MYAQRDVLYLFTNINHSNPFEMACPMGYSSKTLPVDGAEAEKVEEIIIPERDPEFFKPVAEPEILKTITPEAVFVLGGQYAILMQFAHPGLARGSAEHSNFANRIIERLTTTTRYLNVAIYGTPEEKEAITSVIHRYHSRVRGEGYYADDPGMQMKSLVSGRSFVHQD